MNTRATIALIAVASVTVILFASVLTEDANARRCRYRGGGNDNSVHQTSAQACVNQNAACQNVNSQNAGHDIASNTIGNQPSS
jgi:hypothetical protein